MNHSKVLLWILMYKKHKKKPCTICDNLQFKLTSSIIPCLPPHVIHFKCLITLFPWWLAPFHQLFNNDLLNNESNSCNFLTFLPKVICSRISKSTLWIRHVNVFVAEKKTKGQGETRHNLVSHMKAPLLQGFHESLASNLSVQARHK